MEIRLWGTAIACIAQEAIVAGRAVKLTPDVTGNATGAFTMTSFNQGNIVIGAVHPMVDNDVEARYVAGWEVNNSVPPLYETLPILNVGGGAVPYTLREFVQGASNLPATNITVRMTDPRLQWEQTIPSGSHMLAYDEGIYTVTSGCYVYDATMQVGDHISVIGVGANRGRWYKSAAGTVAHIFEYDPIGKLTIKTASE